MIAGVLNIIQEKYALIFVAGLASNKITVIVTGHWQIFHECA